MISIQREPVSAVSSDINFPMKGRRGMKDWARSSEDKLFIPREVLSLASAGEAALGPRGPARSARLCTRVCAHVRLGRCRGVHVCERTSGAGHTYESAHLGACVCVHM